MIATAVCEFGADVFRPSGPKVGLCVAQRLADFDVALSYVLLDFDDVYGWRPSEAGFPTPNCP